MTPSIGKIVDYTLSEGDARAINERRTPGQSNAAAEGEVYPALIVRVFAVDGAPATLANLQVFYDGAAASYWATSRREAQHVPGDLGTWHRQHQV